MHTRLPKKFVTRLSVKSAARCEGRTKWEETSNARAAQNSSELQTIMYDLVRSNLLYSWKTSCNRTRDQSAFSIEGRRESCT